MPISFNDLEDIKNRIIIENDLAYAFPTNMPIVPGHILIVPKRQVEAIEKMTEDEIMAVLDLAEELKPALMELFGVTGFNHAWNEGKDAGQSIPHFHLHLIPRKPKDTGIHQYDPRKFLYRPGSREISPEKELHEVAELIRDKL